MLLVCYVTGSRWRCELCREIKGAGQVNISKTIFYPLGIAFSLFYMSFVWAEDYPAFYAFEDDRPQFQYSANKPYYETADAYCQVRYAYVASLPGWEKIGPYSGAIKYVPDIPGTYQCAFACSGDASKHYYGETDGSNCFIGDTTGHYYCFGGGSLNETTHMCVGGPNCTIGTERTNDGRCTRTTTSPQEGPSCPASRSPIAFGSGNKFLNEADLDVGSIRFTRTYNAVNTDEIAALQIAGVNTQMPLGWGWTYSYQQSVRLPGTSGTIAMVVRPNGKIDRFDLVNGVWTGSSSNANQLLASLDNSGAIIGWNYLDVGNNLVEIYDARGSLQRVRTADGHEIKLTYTNGVLTQIADAFGHQVSLNYDATGHIASLVAGSQQVAYTYDELGNLSVVTRADASQKTYLYGEPAYTSGASLPHALTGIIDPDGSRYISYTYTASGKAIGEEISGGVEKLNIVNTIDVAGNITKSAITDVLGATRTYTFTNVLGRNLLTSISQPGGSGCQAANSNIEYDKNGNVTREYSFSGRQTCHVYDLSRNLETQRLDGASYAMGACPTDIANNYSISAPETNDSVTVTKTLTKWHPVWNLKAAESSPKKLTYWVYNGQTDPVSGQTANCAPTDALVLNKPIAVLCRKIEQATTDESGTLGFSATSTGSPRIWSYTYDQYGHVLTETDPRGQVSTYSYWGSDASCPSEDGGSGADNGCRGELKSVVNALGDTTLYQRYNANGQLLSQQDPNGVLTTYTYSPRGQLKTQTVNSGTVSRQTSYGYDKLGQLIQVTESDGRSIQYTYDSAHRLTDITDSLGNTIHYTLDGAGNRLKEEVKDASGNLARLTTRVFDQLGRLQNLKVEQ